MPQPQTAAKIMPPQEAILDIAALQATPLCTEPYDYLIVPNFISASALEAIDKDYPQIAKRGSFPLHLLSYGPAFKELLAALQGDAFRRAVEQKFSLDLTDKPTMFTVRGHCGTKDGYIHTDSQSKIITVLLYMNQQWQEKEGGRLRVLRSKNIDDVAAEVPPASGTLLLFRRADNSFHGHKPYIGPRKVIQMNWVADQQFADRNIFRHTLSTFFKKLNPFAGY